MSRESVIRSYYSQLEEYKKLLAKGLEEGNQPLVRQMRESIAEIEKSLASVQYLQDNNISSSRRDDR